MSEKDNEVPIKRFSENNMIVNYKRFKTITVNKQYKSNKSCSLTINNAEIKYKELVTFWRIEIVSKLNFIKHIPTTCKKANTQ